MVSNRFLLETFVAVVLAALFVGAAQVAQKFFAGQ